MDPSKAISEEEKTSLMIGSGEVDVSEDSTGKDALAAGDVPQQGSGPPSSSGRPKHRKGPKRTEKDRKGPKRTEKDLFGPFRCLGRPIFVLSYCGGHSLQQHAFWYTSIWGLHADLQGEQLFRSYEGSLSPELCRRQPKIFGGQNYFSLLVSSKSYNIHTRDPPIYKKTSTDLHSSQEGSEHKWGVWTLIPPLPVACIRDHECPQSVINKTVFTNQACIFNVDLTNGSGHGIWINWQMRLCQVSCD